MIEVKEPKVGDFICTYRCNICESVVRSLIFGQVQKIDENFVWREFSQWRSLNRSNDSLKYKILQSEDRLFKTNRNPIEGIVFFKMNDEEVTQHILLEGI